MITLSFKYFIDLFSKAQAAGINSLIIWLVVKKEPYEFSLYVEMTLADLYDLHAY